MRTVTARPWIVHEDEEDRFLPEGPREVTVAGRAALAWVNIQTAAKSRRGAIHLYFWDDGEHILLNLAGRPGFLLATDQPGLLLVGMDHTLGTLDVETNLFSPLATLPHQHPLTCINDGEVLPGGQAVIFGTKDVHFKDPIAHLYLFTPADGAITPLADGQICSNGKVIQRTDQPEEFLLLDIDSPRRCVARYRLNLAERRLQPEGIALDLTGESAFPDGMCPADAESVIVAYYDPAPPSAHTAGRAVRYDLRTGRAVESWLTPGAPRVTCPLLVSRPEGVQLVLTTATEGMPAEQLALAPNSGNLFIAETHLAQAPACDLVRLTGR